jgi:sugar phosphate isomerase/epimerase
MQKSLGLGAIGITGKSLPEGIDIAMASGFDAIGFDIREAATLVDEQGLDNVRGLFAGAHVAPGHWNLPVNRNDDAQFEKDVAELPRLAHVAVELGCLRATSGIMPGSNTLTYEQNHERTVEQFRRAAKPLADAGIRLGIEFIGPKTLRDTLKYPFIYKMEEVLALGEEIGTGNIGVLLDIWHLWQSGGEVSDLDKIDVKDVIVVHVNDAPPGIPRDEQQDLVRALPLETGVLDLVGFMRKLDAMGFDGPVMPEPFSARVNELAEQDPLVAAKLVGESMNQLWAAAGLS